MQDKDKALRRAVRESWPADYQTSFDEAWQAARQRHAASRRRYGYFASAAAIVAAVVVAFNMQAPVESSYI